MTNYAALGARHGFEDGLSGWFRMPSEAAQALPGYCDAYAEGFKRGQCERLASRQLVTVLAACR
jgi:hypothetical protein